jgi:nucleoside-diphosphate-sugar epimerase
MPTIAEGDKVLVSGANGYIGCHVVRILLEKNYAVRGVVRSLPKGRYLSELFKPFGEKFELSIVEDIMKVDIHFCIFLLALSEQWFRCLGRCIRRSRERRERDRTHCISRSSERR